MIERRPREGGGFEYRVTEAGRELEPVVLGLGAWGQRWARSRHDGREPLDPVLLMWDLRRNLDVKRLPERQTVVLFWFRDLPSKRSRYWLRIDRPNVDLCLTNPGLEVDLTVETTLRTMVEVWMGDRDAQQALRSGAIELQGPAGLTRAFPSWLLLNRFANVERRRAARRAPAPGQSTCVPNGRLSPVSARQRPSACKSSRAR